MMIYDIYLFDIFIFIYRYLFIYMYLFIFIYLFIFVCLGGGDLGAGHRPGYVRGPGHALRLHRSHGNDAPERPGR